MWKSLALFLALSPAASSFAGEILYQSFYAGTVLRGVGMSDDLAKKDAMSALPAGYEVDSQNSSLIECTLSEEMLQITNGDRCDTAIPGNLYRLSIPVREVTGK